MNGTGKKWAISAKTVPSEESSRKALETALKNLVTACGHVNLSALTGTTVKDFRKVMAFMAACDAARELVGED